MTWYAISERSSRTSLQAKASTPLAAERGVWPRTTAEKKERRARDDEWAEVMRRVDMLVDAGLLQSQQGHALPTLADACRTVQITPTALTPETAKTLLATPGTYQRTTLRKGLKALDALRDIPRLSPLLPSTPVTPPNAKAGHLVTLPPHLRTAIAAWVDRAGRVQVDDARYAYHAEPLSDSARARYSAAATLFVKTLLELGEELPPGMALDDLFEPDRVNSVFGQWIASGKPAASTCYSYTNDLISLLKRNGHPAASSYLDGLKTRLPRLVEGRAAGQSMSTKTKRWCESLIRDPQKTARFQTQHIEYYRHARYALAAAKAAQVDLHALLSDPTAFATLPDAARKNAKILLRRARMFGLMACYAAIALEGAPYRRQNILSIRHTGPNKTLFLHLTGRDPHAIIKFPNDELKNGVSLTARGEELDPVTIKKRQEGDFGPEILRFYVNEIRPLFPEGARTHCLFPPIKHAATPNSGFCEGTFHLWLAEASEEIGLPLTSHNFRHGYCSIDINEGQRSMEDLAKILGDTTETVQKYYAWINKQQSVLNVQQDAARRRAAIMKSKRSGAK